MHNLLKTNLSLWWALCTKTTNRTTAGKTRPWMPTLRKKNIPGRSSWGSLSNTGLRNFKVGSHRAEHFYWTCGKTSSSESSLVLINICEQTPAHDKSHAVFGKGITATLWLRKGHCNKHYIHNPCVVCFFSWNSCNCLSKHCTGDFFQLRISSGSLKWMLNDFYIHLLCTLNCKLIVMQRLLI